MSIKDSIKSIEKYNNLTDEKNKKIRSDKVWLLLTSFNVPLSLACSIQNSSNKTACIIWGIVCGMNCLNLFYRSQKLVLDENEKKELEEDIQYYNNCLESNNSLVKKKNN